MQCLFIIYCLFSCKLNWAFASMSEEMSMKKFPSQLLSLFMMAINKKSEKMAEGSASLCLFQATARINFAKIVSNRQYLNRNGRFSTRNHTKKKNKKKVTRNTEVDTFASDRARLDLMLYWYNKGQLLQLLRCANGFKALYARG